MNIGTLDRWLRILIGAVLIVLAATDVLGLWAYIGIIPLATGIIRWCPLYTLLGIQTCPLHDTVKR
ncbi:DUF2892 domain-containing protein [Thiomicrospira sp. XS5]|uniref:YgaP family membrane protein n=1 Tax=Thiomicrospira sp. XS5 TaxID=1775636 RepID=UPI0009EAB96A|nr:DUF2892 domain-containing protein [Thiomicrospira sp. XS5]